MPIGDDFFRHDQETDRETLIQEEEKLNIKYIPEDINHRQSEMARLRRRFYEDAIKGSETQCFITGQPGTGKTMVVKFYNRKLKEVNDFEDTEIIYINARNNSSEQAFMMKLFEEIGVDYKRGIPISQNLNRLKKRSREDEIASTIILTVDEIDHLLKGRSNHLNQIVEKLAEPENLFNGHTFGTTLSFLAVSNKPDIKADIDEDIRDSRLDSDTIHFERYDEEELTEILMERQEAAFKDVILDKEALKIIAKEVIENFEGDVRKALEILKKAPKQSGDPSRGYNQEQVVKESINQVRESQIDDILRGADEHRLVLMKALGDSINKDKNKLQDIKDRFNKYCEFSKIEKKKSEDATRSYVYRILENLVEDNFLKKSKNYNEKHHPYYYKLKNEPELLQSKVENKMMRRNLWEEFVEGYEEYKESTVSFSFGTDEENSEGDEKAEEVLDDEEKEKMDKLLG
jgi:cell division control protein 6